MTNGCGWLTRGVRGRNKIGISGTGSGCIRRIECSEIGTGRHI